MFQQPVGGELVARYDEARYRPAVAQGVDRKGLDFVRVDQPPPGERADDRAAGRRGDVARGTMARPAVRLVGGLDTAHHDAVEHGLIAPLGEHRAGRRPGRARDSGRCRDAAGQDGQAG
jgi:hypothetical protein